MKPSAPTPSYHLFVGVDIASREFTAAHLVPGTTPQCETKPFEQTASGFESLQQRLRAYGLEPASILIVMETMAGYWVILATTLYQAGFAVSIVCTKMTKPDVLAPEGSWHYIVYLDLFLAYDYSVNEQLYQVPLLFKTCLG